MQRLSNGIPQLMGCAIYERANSITACSLQIVGVNTPDDHPSPDIIRLMRQELSGQVHHR